MEQELSVRSHQQKHDGNTVTDLTLLSVTWAKSESQNAFELEGTLKIIQSHPLPPSTRPNCSKACPAWMVMLGHGG